MNKTLTSIFLVLGFVMIISSKWFDQDFHKLLFFGGLILSIFSYFFYYKYIEKENRTATLIVFLGLALMVSSDFLSEPINNIVSILGTAIIFSSLFLRSRRDATIGQ